MAITVASQAAFDWNTMNTLSLPNVYDRLLDPYKSAMPTFRLFWAFKQEKALGPDEKFSYDIIYKDYSPSFITSKYVFETDDLDNITKSTWTPIKMGRGAGTDDFEMARYASAYAKYDHVANKVDAIHRGLTKAMNFLLWWDWNSADIAGEQIDVSAQLATMTLPPESLYINKATSVTKAPYSIPMLTRKAVTGYTLGGLPVSTTVNKFWDVVNTDATGATITRSATGDNIDCVTGVTAATCVELDLDAIFEHLDAVSEGVQYAIYAACPPALYRQLRSLITSMNIRYADSPLAEIGLKASIEASEYNCVFYQEPILKALYPNSIFFFDPTAIYFEFETSFAPRIYPWERIPGSNMSGTAVVESYQLVRPDAQGVSAMHGYKASS